LLLPEQRSQIKNSPVFLNFVYLFTKIIMSISRPEPTEYGPYYEQYMALIKHAELIPALEDGAQQFMAFAGTIPADKADYRYASGKWCVKEVIGHLIDTERVFAYRALSFSRNDKSALPGFDEEFWTPESNAAGRSIDELLNEYQLVRGSTIAFYKGCTREMTERTGTANNNKISVRALGFIIAGHEIHHAQVIKERYL
jgi:hypothetical protein